MSRTIRRTYRGDYVRDGQWTHRCPVRDCEWCVRGRAKRAWRRRKRHEVWELEELPDAPVSSPGFVSRYIEDPVARRQRAGEYVSRLNTHYWIDYSGKLRQNVQT